MTYFMCGFDENLKCELIENYPYIEWGIVNAINDRIFIAGTLGKIYGYAYIPVPAFFMFTITRLSIMLDARRIESWRV